MQSRLAHSILENIISKSQSGFRKEHGTVHKVFAARQLEEKSVE